jgi:outer membrane murein-binding lipoprotein Lpp
VRRPALLMLVAALLGIGLLAGCGDDDGGDDAGASTEEFDKAYAPINDDFLELGEEVQQTIQTAEGQSNEALATKFDELAKRVFELRAKLVGLEAPDDYEPDVDRLAASMQVVGGDLSEISRAAEKGQAAEAKTQVQELVRHSVETRTARRALARKTGAKE